MYREGDFVRVLDNPTTLEYFGTEDLHGTTGHVGEVLKSNPNSVKVKIHSRSKGRAKYNPLVFIYSHSQLTPANITKETKEIPLVVISNGIKQIN